MTNRNGQRDGVEAKRRMQFADAALAMAGHEVTDRTLHELSSRVAADAMSADDAIAAGTTHLDAR